MKPTTAAKMRYVGTRADAPLREIAAIAEMLTFEAGQVEQRHMVQLATYRKWVHASVSRAEAMLWLLFYLAFEGDVDPTSINGLRTEMIHTLPKSTKPLRIIPEPADRLTRPLW